MVEEERKRIKLAKHEGIEIGRKQGGYSETKKQYRAEANGKNKVIFDEIVMSLSAV